MPLYIYKYLGLCLFLRTASENFIYLSKFFFFLLLGQDGTFDGLAKEGVYVYIEEGTP